MTDVVREIPNEPDLEPPAPLEARARTNGHPKARSAPPPHDLQAEASLLGAALLGAHQTLEQVPDAAFYGNPHGHIAHAIRQLTAAGQPADQTTVSAQLHHDGLLDQVGGPAAITLLALNCPASSAAPAYARIVLAHHQSRQLMTAAEQALATARTAGAGPALIALRDTLDRLTLTAGAPDHDPDLEAFLHQVDDDYDWLVPGLLEHRDRVILTAQEGTGKSTLLRQIAVQLASGRDPFTLERITPHRVLYVDCENTPRQARRALRRLRDTAGPDYDDGRLRLRILGEAMALADPDVEADLAARIAHHEADIVVIGPLYKMIAGDPIKEEPAKAVADAIDRLRNIRGSAFLIEAHSPYAEGAGKHRPIRPYGASLWSRWPEIGIHLADNGELKHWRGQREQRHWPARLQHTDPWPWGPVEPETPEWDGPTECIEALVAFLEEAGGSFSINQLEARLRERGRGYRKATISDAARMATQEGRIQSRSGARGALLFSALDLSAEPFEDF